MTQFKVFKHPSGVSEAVKQGWSWPAFLFTYIWALVKRQWSLGTGLLAAWIVLGIFLRAARVHENVASVVHVLGLLANVYFGFKGNSWREKNLVSRGYEHVDTVGADNPDMAMAMAMSLKSVNGAR
jgi:Protein of unknown function (DUF2628)